MNHDHYLCSNSLRLTKPVRLGLAAVAACFFAAPVLSNPVNPVVVSGSASFKQVGNVLTVTNSNGAIINWQSFSIGASETTRFIQTSASSAVLNRVLSSDPSLIYGTLTSNGRVWLVNPAGIMVGAGGRVDVAGFVASTLNISNENFLAGRNLFESTPGAGSVVNQGAITTPSGGSVYLIGSNVSNEGIITTPKGETILAAGATVSLIDSALPGVKVDITGSAGNATNISQITAEAGRIGIAGVIVRNSGILNASSVVSDGGRIFLMASQNAYVDGNGRIVATGTRQGSVELLAGNQLSVANNAEIDVGGTNSGTLLLNQGNIALNQTAKPVNPVVVNGAATFNQVGGVLTVTNSNGAIINWDKFSIQPGETTRFQQASAASTVLNRVLDDPTAIYGKLKSNGGVWLVNPAGIMVGPGGRVDVAGYVGSTLNINNTAFHAARLQIINHGTFNNVFNFNQTLTTTPVGGGVYLIGNERTTTVPGGPPVPGAIVSLIDSSTPGIKVDIIGTGGSNLNTATITAAAVRVGIAGVLVRNSGTLGARGSQ